MPNLPGISGISNPDEIAFTPVSEGFLRKHGRKRCSCCRDEGVDRIVEIAPAVNGAARIKAAVCRDHEEEGRTAFSQEWASHRPDDSEAEFSRFGFQR